MALFKTSKHIKIIISIGLFFMIIQSYAQSLPTIDSLVNKSYIYLEKIYYTKEYTDSGKKYLNAYIRKAKLEDNIIEIITGYHLYADYYDNTYSIATKYIDSAITLAKTNKIKTKSYPARLYGKKGYIERVEGNFKRAIDYYLKEIELLYPENKTLINYSNYNIGLIKRDYGDIEGAKSILKKNLEYDIEKLEKYPKDYLETYLYTVHELVRTYRLNKEIDSAKSLNLQELKKAINTKNLGYLFTLNDGIIDCINKDYNSSISKLTPILSKLHNSNDRYNFEIYNLIDAYLYLGKSHDALSNDKMKLYYYKKIDSLAEATNYLTPETKKVYFSLALHYKKSGNNKEQLKYLTKGIKIDSILDTNYKYVNSQLESNYDIPELIKEQKKLISVLKQENVKSSKKQILFFSLLILSVTGLGYFYLRQKLYKKRFKALLKKNESNSKKEKKPSLKINKQLLNIPEETASHIISKLNEFEENKYFLKTNLTLNKLSKRFKTNSKYLAIVLKNTKGKGVSQYINDLRINYVIVKLESDIKFRRYTIKAIAKEVGFNTDQAFSKAFYKKTGIYPSYFIKELNK